jgi:hypothetical protein
MSGVTMCPFFIFNIEMIFEGNLHKSTPKMVRDNSLFIIISGFFSGTNIDGGRYLARQCCCKHSITLTTHSLIIEHYTYEQNLYGKFVFQWNSIMLSMQSHYRSFIESSID